ncbi:MAG: hypothetical protein AB7P40_01240 [Chloroflexota bacterium]
MSVYSSAESAGVLVNASPWIGVYVAEILIPTDAEVRVEQTGRNPSHFTIWANPDRLMTWVVSIKRMHDVE